MDNYYRFLYDGETDCGFDPFGIEVSKRRELILYWLKAVQAYYNDVLAVRGYVFLSEILKYLGISVTPYSRVVGWMKDGDGDGFIDFGITRTGYPLCFELNFNCDGYILDKFD